MQRRVEQAHGDRQPVHGGQDVDEVLPLDLAQLLQRRRLLRRRVGQDHAAHHGQAVLAQEHVLGAAQADALGARATGRWRRPRRCRRWPARPGGPVRMSSAHDSTVAKAGGGAAAVSGTWPATTMPGPAVEGDPVALVRVTSPTVTEWAGQAQDLGPDHGRLAPAPGHHGGVADQTAPGGQDPLGGQHAVHVLGRGLAAHQNDLLAPLRRRGGVVGREVDPAHGGARAGAEALGPHRVARPGELRVQHRVEMVLGDARHGLGLGDAQVARAHHVHRHLQGGRAGALAHPGLQHPELALVDGELGVAHVAVVAFEAGEDGQQLGVHLGELLLELGDGLGVADAGHHVLALGVDQEVAVGALGPGGRVTGEADPGARVVVAVAEHHGLDVDRGAQVVGDALAVAVGDGPGPVPAAEHRLDGPAQLRRRVLGEGRLVWRSTICW